MPQTLKFVRYMVTSVLQEQQYMFGVRSLLVDCVQEIVVDEKRSGLCVDAAITAVKSLVV